MSSETDRVRQVNELLQKAFGKKVRGNFVTGPSGHVPVDNLENIVRNGFLFQTVIGKFDDEKGLKIKVKPEYEGPALVYSNLVEEEWGEKPKVIVQEDHIDLTRVDKYFPNTSLTY